MQLYSPSIYGVVALDGSIACSPRTGRKIDIYNDGATIYGFGLNDFEYCIFGGEGSSLTYRIASPGLIDLAGPVAFRADISGISLPAGGTLAIGANNLTLDAAGALLVNGAPLSGGGGATGTMASQNANAVAITGGSIAGTTFGTGVNTLALTGGATGVAPSVAPAGTAANIDLALAAKGTGSVIVRTGGGVAYGMSAPAGAVNYIASTGAATGFSPTFTATGTDANVGIWFASKGTASIFFSPGGVTGVQASNPTNAVNFVAMSGAIAANAPSISAAGSDTNVSLTLAGKGTGTVNVAGAFASNGYRYCSGGTGLAAAGTTQATAYAINRTVSVFTTVAANSGARLPNLPPVTVGGVTTFAEFEIFNTTATALLLYPATGLSVNALAANAALSVVAGAAVRGVQHSTTNYRFG